MSMILYFILLITHKVYTFELEQISNLEMVVFSSLLLVIYSIFYVLFDRENLYSRM